jgi:hypothetical protein
MTSWWCSLYTCTYVHFTHSVKKWNWGWMRFSNVKEHHYIKAGNNCLRSFLNWFFTKISSLFWFMTGLYFGYSTVYYLTRQVVYMWRSIEACSFNHCYSGKAIIIKCCEWMCTLSYAACNARAPYSHMTCTALQSFPLFFFLIVPFMTS